MGGEQRCLYCFTIKNLRLCQDSNADEEDDIDFKKRFTSLRAEFEAQLKEESELNARILTNLEKIQLPE